MRQRTGRAAQRVWHRFANGEKGVKNENSEPPTPKAFGFLIHSSALWGRSERAETKPSDI